jgi:hypothetical protein
VRLSNFNRAWPEMLARATRRPPPDSLAVVALPSDWRANGWSTAIPVLVGGDVAHRGTLVVDGDLIVRGRLRILGLLIVRGAIDVRDGALDVKGALVVMAPDARPSTFGPRTVIQYEPCTALRALATIGRPTTVPFRLWVNR